MMEPHHIPCESGGGAVSVTSIIVHRDQKLAFSLGRLFVPRMHARRRVFSLVLLVLWAMPQWSLAQPGSLDLSFAPALTAGAAVYVVTLQTNGQILIGGSFTATGSVSVVNVARLNPDGSLDATFNPGTAADTGYVDAIAVQTDGKVLIGGAFSSSTGATSQRLTRLNPDGSVDEDFDPSLVVDQPVNAVALQSDGRILIGGSFVLVDFTLRRSVARLNTNGTLDLTFDACVATSAGLGATALALQNDGRILVTGSFSFTSGAARQGIARLGHNEIGRAH